MITEFPTWLDKLEKSARQTLSKPIYDFIAGGADDEQVLQNNIRDYNSISIVPNVLKDVSKIDLSLTICGTQLRSPILIAPSAPHKILYQDGELATETAANKTNTLMIVSFMASVSLEKIAQNSTSDKWFQMQILKNKKVTENLVYRASDAGYKAIVVTVDMPIVGNRHRDTINKFRIPSSCLPVNLIQEGLMQQSAEPTMLKFKHANTLFDPSVTWKEIEWLRKISPVPILLKGILDPDDATLALETGINGIIVSNHGGRQLGASISTIRALPGIVAAIQNKIPILVDGGIRSGIDVFKALSLGAKATLIGRPVLWGLATGGTHGVSGVLRQLNHELTHTMQLCGKQKFEKLVNDNLKDHI